MKYTTNKTQLAVAVSLAICLTTLTGCKTTDSETKQSVATKEKVNESKKILITGSRKLCTS